VSDAFRDCYTRATRCGKCRRPFDGYAYAPGRYEAWTWPDLPVCRECSAELTERAERNMRALAAATAAGVAPC
jgi:hypothetical protein